MGAMTPPSMEAMDFDPFASGAIERVIPTTEAQREIWLADGLAAQASLAYNESVSLTLRGALDHTALEMALNRLLARHESLRATIASDGMQLLIGAQGSLKLPLHDLTALALPARQTELSRLRAQAVETGFDLERGPLLRAALCQCEPAWHELLLTAHHIVCDGWSWGVIIDDLARLYAEQVGLGPSPDLPPTYEDYARWERAQASDPAMHEHTGYWLEQFGGGVLPVMELPLDRARPALRTFASRRVDVLLERSLIEVVRKLGAASGASLFSTLFGAFAGTLHRLTQQDDLVIGVPAAGQAVSDMPALVGHCVNLLPIRIRVDADLDIQALIRQSSRTLMDAFEHQTLTYGTLLKKLQLPRDPSRPTLVSVMFNLDRNATTPGDGFPGLQVETRSNPRHFENFDLFLNCSPTTSGLQLECQFNTGLFDESSVRRWLDVYRTALQRFAASPGLSVRQAFALGDSDRRLLATFNATEAPYEAGARIESLIAAQASATPEAIAVVAGAHQLSYRELDRRANALAHELLQHGVGVGDLVGLCCSRNEHMLVALVGILKAGAGYVSLDPSFPRERLDFMTQDAGLRLVVIDASTGASWADKPVRVLPADTRALAAVAPAVRATSQDVAYVIYTSGSTGRPKGVRVPHRSVVNLLTGLRTVPGMRADHVVLAVTTLSFDIAVSEVIMPLTVGARVIVADKLQSADGDALRVLVESEHVTFIDATPSTWRLLIDAGWPGRADLLAICTGEPLPPDLGRQLRPLVQQLWNGYGPTETTVWSSFHRVAQDSALVPIGRPVANTRFDVLDTKLEPLPVGVTGELYIGGAGVTLGYLNRPELTSQVFLPDPAAHEAGQRRYRTGDLGRWRSDGILECLGRADHQVKVRGYRIELGEIESNLTSHEAVDRALVVTREDAPGDVRIVAYVVPRGPMPDAAQLKRHLAEFLPDYMLPQHFVELAAVPLLPNGKVNRSALPPPELRLAGADPIRLAPSNDLERKVLESMEQVLRLPGMSMDDDFFALGGHSLLAARLTAQLGREFELKLSLATLFESPSALKLSRAIAKALAEGHAPPVTPIVPLQDQGLAPLTPMQERIRFVEELHPGRPVYNVPSGHRLTGPLDLVAFEATLREIVRRQATLRTFVGSDPKTSKPAQMIAESIAFTLPVEDLRAIPQAEREAALRERMQQVADTPMDIHQAPLFRVALYRLAENEHAFAFVPHHLIWDGWSFDLFQSEMAAIYAAFSNGQPSPLPELTVNYGDYAAWYQDWLAQPEAQAQLDYWKGRFALAAPSATPRTDRPRRAGMTGEGGTCAVSVDQTLTEQLREIARAHNVTLSMLTLGALTLMMSHFIGASAIVIATPVRGREAPELETVMGFFNNLLPLPLEVDPVLSFGEFLLYLKGELTASLHCQGVPFERLASEPEFIRLAQRGPLYQALFSFQDARERPQMLGDLQHRQIHLLQRGATDDLGLWLMDKPNGMEGGFIYNADIYLPETGAAFRDRYVELLSKIARQPDATLATLRAVDGSEACALLQRLAASTPHSARDSADDAKRDPTASTAQKLLMPEQAQLAQVWASVLGIDVNDIRPSDNFFDLGGDSLLAMRAIEHAEQALGFRIEARRYVFESVAQLSSSAGAIPSHVDAPPTDTQAAPRGILGRMFSALGRKQ